jgi:hypothetical protein
MLIKWKGFKKLNGTKILGWPFEASEGWHHGDEKTGDHISLITHQQPLTRTKLHQVFLHCATWTLDRHDEHGMIPQFYLDWNLMKIASDYPYLGNSLPVYHLGNYLPLRVLESSSTPEEVAVLVSVAVSRRSDHWGSHLLSGSVVSTRSFGILRWKMGKVCLTFTAHTRPFSFLFQCFGWFVLQQTLQNQGNKRDYLWAT